MTGQKSDDIELEMSNWEGGRLQSEYQIIETFKSAQFQNILQLIGSGHFLDHVMTLLQVQLL